MELTWLGTAGFIARTKDAEIAFDPFLSRGAGKSSPFTPNSFQNTRAIFVGHGHFDHTFDIPRISTKSDARVFAPGLTGQVLKLRGVSGSRLGIASNDQFLFPEMRVRAFKSAHVQFDLSSEAKELQRKNARGSSRPCSLHSEQGLRTNYFNPVKPSIRDVSVNSPLIG